MCHENSKQNLNTKAKVRVIINDIGIPLLTLLSDILLYIFLLLLLCFILAIANYKLHK